SITLRQQPLDRLQKLGGRRLSLRRHLDRQPPSPRIRIAQDDLAPLAGDLLLGGSLDGWRDSRLHEPLRDFRPAQLQAFLAALFLDAFSLFAHLRQRLRISGKRLAVTRDAYRDVVRIGERRDNWFGQARNVEKPAQPRLGKV